MLTGDVNFSRSIWQCPVARSAVRPHILTSARCRVAPRTALPGRRDGRDGDSQHPWARPRPPFRNGVCSALARARVRHTLLLARALRWECLEQLLGPLFTLCVTTEHWTFGGLQAGAGTAPPVRSCVVQVLLGGRRGSG